MTCSFITLDQSCDISTFFSLSRLTRPWEEQWCTIRGVLQTRSTVLCHPWLRRSLWNSASSESCMSEGNRRGLTCCVLCTPQIGCCGWQEAGR
jgi:hypothetical protein